MPEAFAAAPEAFAAVEGLGAAEIAGGAIEGGLAAGDLGAGLGAGAFGGAVASGAEAGLGAGFGAVDAAAPFAAEAVPFDTAAADFAGGVSQGGFQAELAPGVDLSAFQEPSIAGTPSLGGDGGIGSDFATGNVGDLGVDTGGFSSNFGADTPVSDASPVLSDTGVYQPGMTVDPAGGGYYNTPQGAETYTGGPGVGTPGEDVTAASTLGGQTVTTTTGAPGGGGLFGGNNLTQLGTLGALAFAGMMGPGKLPSAGVAEQGIAAQLSAQGQQLQARALANQISPAQQAELQTIRAQLVAQAYTQFGQMDPGGDPSKDSRFLQTIQNIDNNIAKQYQAFVDAEFNQGLQDLQLASQDFNNVLTAEFRNKEDFDRALFQAAMASSSLLGRQGGGSTTNITVT